MRNLVLALALLLAGSVPSVWAMNCPQVQSATDIYRCTMEVFNDTGSAVTSNSVVAWDDDDTDFSTSNYPYILTTTTADDPYTAGVMLTGSCADQTLCEIVVWGPATVRILDSSDDAGVDTLVGTSTTAGQVGDFAAGANTCSLGMLVDSDNPGANDSLGTVFVDVDCN